MPDDYKRQRDAENLLARGYRDVMHGGATSKALGRSMVSTSTDVISREMRERTKKKKTNLLTPRAY